MKRICILSLIMASFCLIQTSYGQNIWVQKDSVKGPPKSACVAFAGYSIGYIGLGFDQFDYKRALYAYNPNFDAWDKVESFGGELSTGLNRSSAAAFLISGKAYVGTGQGANPYFGDIWEYNLTTNTWTQKANFGGTPRTEAVGFTAGQFGFIGTGKDASGFTNDFWKYDPATNIWTSVSSFPGTARKQAVAVSLGNSAFVGTGDDGAFTGDFYKYNSSSDTWSSVANFGGTPRYGAVAFAIYPNIFVGTGYDNTLSYTKDFWSYNILNDTWSQVLDFPGSARSNAAAFAIGSSGFVGTGYDGQPQDDFYEYVPLLSVLGRDIGDAKAYPNPANNYFQINLKNESAFNTESSLELYSSDGRLALKSDFKAGKLISTQNIKSGTYFYIIRSENSIQLSGKIVVSHD